MSDHAENRIVLPAPTAWPVVLACGITLLGAGYLMHPMLGIVGAAAVWLGCVGWFRDVLPVEREEVVPFVAEPPVVPSARRVLGLRVGTDAHRMRVPLHVHPYSVGLKAGLARFSPGGLILGSVAHLSLSVLVGVLYAALLPIFSRRPMLTAWVLIPVLMSGITWALLRAVNPLLNARIEWTWFVASQVAFGVLAGWVVSRSEPIATAQLLPLPLRAGLEGSGLYSEQHDESSPCPPRTSRCFSTPTCRSSGWGRLRRSSDSRQEQ